MFTNQPDNYRVPFHFAELRLPQAHPFRGPNGYDPSAAETRDVVLARTPETTLPEGIIREALSLFPAEARILEQFGVHPLRPSRSFRNPFTGAAMPGDLDTGNAKDSWRNCGRHCVSVAHGAALIAQDFCDHGLIEEPWVARAFSAGLLHDADTRIRHFDYQRRHEKGPEYVAPPEDFLRAQGVSDEAAEFHAAYDDPTGAQTIYKFFWFEDPQLHNVCDQLIENTINQSALSLLQKEQLLRLIVRTVDDMTYTEIGGAERSFFLTARERLDCCSDRGWYKTLQRSALGVDSNGTVVYVEDMSKVGAQTRIASDILSMQVFVPNRVSTLHKMVCAPFAQEDPCEYTTRRLRSGFPWILA
ncbi:MAG: hypothetical protein K1X83_11905 [Oligoflexia bacterium]|nr:hypothetical protein [Oligoflexia bacterium]